MRAWGMMVVGLACAGCASPGTVSESLPVIHPKVFSMAACWLSDRVEPVVTEINLDAVRKNGNQFNEPVRTEGAWTRVDLEEGGFMRYRVISGQGSSCAVEFQDNGGGTLTRSRTIHFTLSYREIRVDGKPQRSRVLRIEALD